jgi:hypothetical protein
VAEEITVAASLPQEFFPATPKMSFSSVLVIRTRFG